LFPVIFLYRQFLELTLKDLIRQALNCLDRSPAFPQTHKLDDLWRAFRGLLDELDMDDDSDEMKQIGRLIDEFCAVDPMSQAFRYREDRKGNPSLPGMATIDVANVRAVIQKISVMLDGADEALHQHQLWRSEMMSAY